MQTSRIIKLFQNALSILVFSMLITSQFGGGANAAKAHAGSPPVEVRWFIGIGTGADPAQVTVEQQVVDDFNASHPNIHLTLEIVPSASARDTLWAEIVNGNAPDIVGPVGWIGSNQFHGQWLDLAPLITSTGFDTSIFDPALVSMYQTDEGTVGLPFAVYPSAIYYNPALFTTAGLNPPPAHYGDQYQMPGGSMVAWSWDTLTQVAKLLTLDSTGKNATEAGFDVTKAVQFGFSFGWEGHPNYWGSFWKAGSILQGSVGSYTAQIPADWKAAWQWVYDGIWGAQPFIPNGAVAGGADFDSGNVFASGKLAMLDNPSWYLCCITDLTNASGTFQFGAMPTYNGVVGGRIDADTFRIPKASSHPNEAFTVLTYLVTTGVDKLIVGTSSQAPAYGAISAITAKQTPWLNARKDQFPFVTDASWDILLAGLNYPDVPSAEAFMPNINEAWARLQTFADLLVNTKDVDLAAEEATLESDLTSIFNNNFITISGNAGVAGATLNYYDGSNKTATSIYDGSYALHVSSGWSGTITPSKSSYVFTPPFRTYTYLLTDKPGENYTATTYRIYMPLVMKNVNTIATQIRWFIGIGTGADPAQVVIEQQVVNDFNASNPDIHLSLEIIPNASARDALSTEIAAGAGPDIVGPVGWIGSEAFHGQWLDIAPYIASTNYDTSKFEAALTAMYQTDQGTVGLPFAVYPSAIYYNTRLFTEAGVNPPPTHYGDKYTMPDSTSVDWNWDALTKVAKLLTIDSTGKTALDAGFDVTKAVQYGFSFGWEGHPNYWGTFMSNGGQLLVPGGAKGTYAAAIPDGWKQAWQWVYDGIWGAQPYIPNGAVAGGADYDSGNVFASGKLAMLDNPSWYLCCLNDLIKAGGEFDFGAMPIGLDGAVAGRVDADTFRIWKGTKHPAEAFTVYAYLIDIGIQKLVVGTPGQAPAYGAIPSQTALREPWLDAQKASFPFVTNAGWDVLLAGLNHPDIPAAESYMPNINESWARTQTFGDLLANTKGVNLAAQEAALVADLDVIFNK